MDILAAEQNRAIRETLRGVIEVLGHQVVEAADAGEVATALSAHHTELALIVLSWDLPGAGGVELIRRIRSDARFLSIPIMVLFDDQHAAHAIEAFQAGARECISRTATEQDLATRMLECLGRAA